MKPQVMFRTRAHLSLEIVLSLGKVYTVLIREYEQGHTVWLSLTDMFFSEGGCTVMRHLAEAKTHQKQGCSCRRCCFCSTVVSTKRCCFPCLRNSLDFRAVVLLGLGMVSMLTWFGSLDAAPPGPLLEDTAFSFSSCMANKKKNLTQSVCLERRVKWLHSVSSSDSFISKPKARQAVSLRGVFKSNLVYSLFCLNKNQYFCYRKVLYMNSFQMDLSNCIFKCRLWFQQRHPVVTPLQKSRWGKKGSCTEQK